MPVVFLPCDRQTKNAAIQGPEPLVAHDHGIIDMTPPCQAENGRGIIVHGDGNNLKTLWTQLLLPEDEMRHFNLAWRAPRGPESEKHHAAAKRRKIGPLAVNVVARKFGSRLVHQQSG